MVAELATSPDVSFMDYFLNVDAFIIQKTLYFKFLLCFGIQLLKSYATSEWQRRNQKSRARRRAAQREVQSRDAEAQSRRVSKAQSLKLAEFRAKRKKEKRVGTRW